MEGTSSVSSREKMEGPRSGMVEDEGEDAVGGGGWISMILMLETRVREGEEEGVEGGAMEDSPTKEEDARCDEGRTDPACELARANRCDDW